MPAADTESPSLTLTLNQEERAKLLSILERELQDTRVEARRTRTPDFQEHVHHEEAVLRGLIDKLRQV